MATPLGQVAASGAVSLDKPTVAFVGAANAVHLQLTAAARLDLHLDGVPAGGVFIEAAPTVDVPIIVEQDQVFNKGKADLSAFTVNPGQLRMTWYDSPPDGRQPDGAALRGIYEIKRLVTLGL